MLVDGVTEGTTTVAANGTWSLTPTPALSNAIHTATATETNAGGTSSPSTADTFTVDTTVPPPPSITAPASGTTVATATPTISGTGQASDKLTVLIDGATAGTTTVATNGTWSLTPTAALSNTSHTATATETNAAGTPSLASTADTFTVNVPTTSSLFTATNTPAQTSLNDGSQLELGMKFTSSVAGEITALDFYRSASDTGPDILDLWSSTGTLLGSATFSNTAASGWQTVNLTAPVSIAANTTYVASYHTTGEYVATDAYFTSNVTSGVLTAPSTGNGVYAYGGTATSGLFPTNTYNASNYWVDVVFSGDPNSTPETPTLSITNPSLNVTAGGSVALGITATPVDSDDILSVQISGLPSYETITAPTGNTVTSQQQADGTYTWTISESSSTTGAPLAGLTLSSSYTGTDHPVATLTVTASNTTSGETANSAPQTIMVTDPPATTLASATTSAQRRDLQTQVAA